MAHDVKLKIDGQPWHGVGMKVPDCTPQPDVNTCKRCDSPLIDGRCSDVTCPFSDCSQDDDKGWDGHPDH